MFCCGAPAWSSAESPAQGCDAGTLCSHDFIPQPQSGFLLVLESRDFLISGGSLVGGNMSPVVLVNMFFLSWAIC